MLAIKSLLRHARLVISASVPAAVLAVAAAVAATSPALAQTSPTTQVRDASALRPPQGVKVAIFEFGDMECPMCGHVNPTLKEAAEKYNIPWLRHDFLIPGHPWSPQAATNARWFDLKSKKLGDDYRDYIFQNQVSIYSRDVLATFTQKFAQAHGIAMPFAIDPQGKLAAAVQADVALGQRIGIDHTPTIWIVTSGSRGAPFIEVTDINKLYQIIDQALVDTKGAAPARRK